MIQVNMHEAKTQLSKLVKKAADGETFIIAKAGKPLVRVIPFDAPLPKKSRRLGSMRDIGHMAKDLDFKALGRDEIMEMFYGESEK